MLAVMPERQSDDRADVLLVDDREAHAVATLARILQEVARERGWIKEDGRVDVAAFEEATDVRWQTAQFWVYGRTKTLPKAENLVKLSRAIGMNVDELIGLASGKEPTNAAWLAFLETPQGARMTPEERRVVGSRWVHRGRKPSVLFYQLELAALRAADPDDPSSD